jgi:O-antigen ligase
MGPVLQHAVRVGAGAVTFALMVNLIPDRRRWWQALWLFLVAGIAEATFGILARALYPFGINLGVQVSWNFTEPIPYGTFQEGNLFGSHTATWAITLLALGPVIPRMRRPLWLVGLLVLVVALYLSLSRAAWLTFAVGVLLVWAFGRPTAWHRLNRLLLGVLAAPFLVVMALGVAPLLPASWPFVDRLQSFLRLSTDPTFSARLHDWTLAWNDWLQQPLMGWGPGSFYELHGLLRANPAWISNLTLRLLQETGVVGLAVFALFVLTLLIPALKVAEKQAAPAEAAALRGLVIAYAVLIGLAYQSTDGIWLTASWVHAGLIAAGARVFGKRS